MFTICVCVILGVGIADESYNFLSELTKTYWLQVEVIGIEPEMLNATKPIGINARKR